MKIVIGCLVVIGMLLLLPACSATQSSTLKEKNNFPLLQLLKKIRQLRQGESSGFPAVLLYLLSIVFAALIYKYVTNMMPDPEDLE